MLIALEQHIETNPGIRGGKPCIAGTRIAVADVVLLHLRHGQSLEQIAGHYALSLSALHAAMTYYYDHRAEIDAAMQEEADLLDVAKNARPSLLESKLRTLSGGRENPLPS
jgi:uncharacterized protein (DUF433 family)